jgi:hypothetical protein
MEKVLWQLEGNLTDGIYSDANGGDDLLYEKFAPICARVGRFFENQHLFFFDGIAQASRAFGNEKMQFRMMGVDGKREFPITGTFFARGVKLVHARRPICRNSFFPPPCHVPQTTAPPAFPVPRAPCCDPRCPAEIPAISYPACLENCLESQPKSPIMLFFWDYALDKC